MSMFNVGISGLAAARRIAARGHQVTLFEGESALGGLAKSFSYAGSDLERFYHCLLPNDAALIAHIQDGIAPSFAVCGNTGRQLRHFSANKTTRHNIRHIGYGYLGIAIVIAFHKLQQLIAETEGARIGQAENIAEEGGVNVPSTSDRS